MAEIQILKSIAFDNGFAIESSQNLISGATYNLNIFDGTTDINKVYIPIRNGRAILDSWGNILPINTNICFTLSDTFSTCPNVTCSMIIE